MVLSSVPSQRFVGSGAVKPSDAAHPLAQLNPASLWEPLHLPASRLFGTDGIRGRADDWLTPALAAQVGFCAGQILASTSTGKPVILGQDSRNSSEQLAIALAAGLTAAGLEVWHLGLCPTPAVAHLTATTEALGGVMISASHNPPADNGIKFFDSHGRKLAKDVQADIEQALRRIQEQLQTLAEGSAPSQMQPFVLPEPQWESYSTRPELLMEYKQALYTSLKPAMRLDGLKVVLDLAWGASVFLAPTAFAELGAEVICLHDQPDGDRINVNCGSTHIEPLRAAIENHGADLGFAFDGDADRVIAMDGQGRVVDGDRILYLWGQALKQADALPNNTIVATVMSNLGFERAWEAAGGTLVRTAVGDQHVYAEMTNRGALLGGEQSGHILCHHYSVSGDGTLTALHLAHLVQASGQSLAELVDDSFETYPQMLRNVRVEDAERRLHWHESERLQQAIAHAEQNMGDRGRVLIRASGTEPVIRVMVEAASEALLNHWMAYLVEAVEHYACD